MRISDWSSDVCSSELGPVRPYTLKRQQNVSPSIRVSERTCPPRGRGLSDAAVKEDDRRAERYNSDYHHTHQIGIADLEQPPRRSKKLLRAHKGEVKADPRRDGLGAAQYAPARK